jgi:hypothetical protein
MLASGGVLTEIYRDRALRLAPVDLETAHQMIAEVKSMEMLSGYRGRPAGDLDALAAAIVALSGSQRRRIASSSKRRSIRYWCWKRQRRAGGGRSGAARGAMTGTVRLERDGNIAVLVIDNPPVNASSADVRRALLDAVQMVEPIPPSTLPSSSEPEIRSLPAPTFGNSVSRFPIRNCRW